MTNTDRVAQALRELLAEGCYGTREYWQALANANMALAEHDAALASLAPAAVSPVGAERFRALVTYAVEHLPADDGRLVMKEWQRQLAEESKVVAPAAVEGDGTPAVNSISALLEKWRGPVPFVERLNPVFARGYSNGREKCADELSAVWNGDFETAERCRIELLEKYRDKCEEVAALTAQCARLKVWHDAVKEAEKHHKDGILVVGVTMIGWINKYAAEKLAAIAAGNGEGV